jgi:hypothetical protein
VVAASDTNSILINFFMSFFSLIENALVRTAMVLSIGIAMTAPKYN